jgi:murein DD-endopeptidase MepM/ murein hydrolase activator NlpD
LNLRLIAASQTLLQRAAHALEHHPRHVTALIAALLLGGGGGAFAVASLDPEPETVTVRQVLETVQALPLQQQLAALDVHRFNLFRSETTRPADTVVALLSRLGVNDGEAAAFLRADRTFRAQFLGRAGRSVTAEASDTQSLTRLVARWAPEDNGTFQRLIVERTPQGFTSRVETAPLVATARLGSATVRSSLFAAADDARIPDSIVGQLVELFSGDVDFHHSLHAGDRFNVVYEVLEADGEPMRAGRILSAEFANNGKLHQAMWFQEPGSAKGSYFTPDGKSLDTSYLASPVEFSRVTSGFAMRKHPVLHRWQAHLGVDYGAVTGTPVRTVGDGQVEFAGEQNGFGNVVIIKHSNTDQTLYAHLSRIDVRPGQAVHQGQTVGAVGATGWVTGPHLHFEFRVNGVHHDPTEMARHSDAVVLTEAARPAFNQLARSMRFQLAAAASSSPLLARAD